MDISQEPINTLTEDEFTNFGLQLVYDNTKTLEEIVDCLKHTLENAFATGINNTNVDENTKEKILANTQSKKESNDVVSLNPSSFFLSEDAEKQSQSQVQAQDTQASTSKK